MAERKPVRFIPMPRFPPAVMLGVKNVKPTSTTIAAQRPCVFFAEGTALNEYSLSSACGFRLVCSLIMFLPFNPDLHAMPLGRHLKHVMKIVS
jgi:hypothetical protein